MKQSNYTVTTAAASVSSFLPIHAVENFYFPMIREQQQVIDRIRGQMKTIRKERYRIARETKFLQLQETALKNENIDLRNKINELLIAKLQRGPLQSSENITNGVSSPVRPP